MKFPINRNCPLIGEANHRLIAYIPAGSVASGNPTYRSSYSTILNILPEDEFPIVESRGGFVFAGWLPPGDFLKKGNEDVINHTKTITETAGYRRGLMDFGANFLRVIEKVHGSSTRPLRLLDFGCGYGTLLRLLSSRDIDCYGYEPSVARRSTASRNGLKVFNSLDELESVGPFDSFICTEVLEHVP
jgi:hypothetical protein